VSAIDTVGPRRRLIEPGPQRQTPLDRSTGRWCRYCDRNILQKREREIGVGKTSRLNPVFFGPRGYIFSGGATRPIKGTTETAEGYR
jgi:hypothetical protein